MNLQQLYYFKAIAELEHYTKAAEKLLVSQSSLSHAIAGLEDELNVKLFARKGRNVVLTKYGRLLLPYVSKSLETLETGMTKLNDFISPETGMVSLACFPSLTQFVPEIIVRYISETNRVNVRLQSNQEATLRGAAGPAYRGQGRYGVCHGDRRPAHRLDLHRRA